MPCAEIKKKYHFLYKIVNKTTDHYMKYEY